MIFQVDASGVDACAMILTHLSLTVGKVIADHAANTTKHVPKNTGKIRRQCGN